MYISYSYNKYPQQNEARLKSWLQGKSEPLYARQPGLVKVYTLFSVDRKNEFVALSYWETEELYKKFGDSEAHAEIDWGVAEFGIETLHRHKLEYFSSHTSEEPQSN